jgi:hypothetical protein
MTGIYSSLVAGVLGPHVLFLVQLLDELLDMNTNLAERDHFPGSSRHTQAPQNEVP